MRERQARAGDIILLYGDESQARTLPYLAHAWARRGRDLRVEAPGRSRSATMPGVVEAATRQLQVRTSPTQVSRDFIALLADIEQAYGPRPDGATRPVVLVLDHGAIHTSKASTAALMARPWLTVEWLPKYAPEFNPIERRWRDLKRHCLAHRTFASTDHLDAAIHEAVADMNRERQMCEEPCKAA